MFKFTGFGGGKKEKSKLERQEQTQMSPREERVLVPGFVEDPELEAVIAKLRDLGVRIFAEAVDGTREKHGELVTEKTALLEVNKEKLATYLAPYASFLASYDKARAEQDTNNQDYWLGQGFATNRKEQERFHAALDVRRAMQK